MVQNPKDPQEPEPPVFPAVNWQQPMTRREARQIRQARENRQVQDVDQPHETRQEQEPAVAQEFGYPRNGVAVEADEWSPQPTAPLVPPPVESAGRHKMLAGEGVNTVTAGPISGDRAAETDIEGESVVVSARNAAAQSQGMHSAATADEGRSESPAHAIFGSFVADRGEAMSSDTGESLVGGRSQNFPLHKEPPRRKRRWLKPVIGTVVTVAVLVACAGIGYAVFQPQVSELVAKFAPAGDYTGGGTGQVSFTISSGDDGSSIASNLHAAGVTKSYDAFYQLLLQQHPQVLWQPGVFTLKKQMSAQAALAALQDPANRAQNAAVIPEGTAEKDVLQIVADATTIPLVELQQAAANPAEYGLPEQATTLEGFLFPATYTFPPGITAHDAIKTMVDRSFQALDEAAVAPADRWKTVVLASIVQREASLKDDYPKVARVFLNRLAQGWDLQSDATVAYGTGNTHRVETTDAERGDASNLYNTYVHPGLPVGPISNPGDIAINAVMHPADGPWMFFVTWNLESGETIFSTTAAEHETAVDKWLKWMRDHPDYE